MVSFTDVGKMWSIGIKFRLRHNQLIVPHRVFKSTLKWSFNLKTDFTALSAVFLFLLCTSVPNDLKMADQLRVLIGLLSLNIT